VTIPSPLPAPSPGSAPPAPREFPLEIEPRARFDVIDIRERIAARHGDALQAYPRTLYFSFHTTAGYLEQGLAARLAASREGADSPPGGIEPYFTLFQTLFPADAGYRHDEIENRDELSETQKLSEPKNADSHLTFIGAGLRSCVTYQNRRDTPVYFIDLDGVNGEVPRHRLTTAVGFTSEEVVARERLQVRVSAHPIDSVNLKDPGLGFYDQLNELVARHGISKGRVKLALAASERRAGLTVNEYETLLMQHDLREVLHNPLKYMVEKASNALADPRAIPNRAVEYAKYDLVRVLNQTFEHFGWSESFLERVTSRFMAYPAERFLRLKRSLSLLVSDREGHGQIQQGVYQSPILVQWEKPSKTTRAIDVTLTRFV
jgi:thiamine phosphate synthase YjbQ (UPF0047 family)